MSQPIRNIAIIAHVDHGKTTLVDALLRQSETRLGKVAEGSDLIMDSNELERERGITIFSKNAAVVYNGVKINIIDTPGHADFGGEVERVMQMADGVLLVIDAKEGPMPQTKFVLQKALRAGHRAIVVINKIDKKDARIEWALNETFNLFIDLGATDAQANFPVIYASAMQGKAGRASDLAAMTDIRPLFDTILEHIPSPRGDASAPLQMLVAALAADAYKGKLGIGRIVSGRVSGGQTVTHITRDGVQTRSKVTTVMTFDGLGRTETEDACAGDIVAIAGIPDVHIGDTIADAERPMPLPPIAIEQPTVKMMFGVNTSPFAGREGQYCTSRNLRERLLKELETDVALRVEQGETMDTFVVSGRGELHLSILIEKMRREGYELHVSRPEVIFSAEGGSASGGHEAVIVTEPYEDTWIEVEDAYRGAVLEAMGRRKGEMKDMRVDTGVAHFHFRVPTRGLIGYRNEFLTDTRGTGIMNTLFAGYEPVAEGLTTNPHGSLVSFETGESNNYGLLNAQERGTLFIGAGLEVYEGMIVGQNAKPVDLEVNICKTKRLSNIRSKGEGVAEGLKTPRNLSLEDSLEYIGDDELVEVTPKSIRLRKKILKSVERARTKRGERDA